MFMFEPVDIPDLPDDDAVLREIAAMDLDLALARRLYGQAMAEPDADKAAHVTRAYNRVTRSLRQSIALRAKLAQDWESHEVFHGRRRDAAPARPFPLSMAAAPQAPTPVARAEAGRRRAALQQAIQRIIWNERETERLDRPTAAILRERTGDDVCDSAAEAVLAATPIEHLVADVCRRYGLSYNPDWERLPQPPDSWLHPRLELADDG